MRNRPMRASLPLLCICCVCVLGSVASFGAYVALGAQSAQEPQEANSQEQMVFEAIRNADASIHVVAHRPIPESITAELTIRFKLPMGSLGNRRFIALEIMSVNADSAARFSRMGAPVWVNPKYANWPEMIIIDESVILKNFASPSDLEVIEDSSLAMRHISELKKDRGTHKNERENLGWGCLGELLWLFMPR